jgi:hypothetical protein
MKDPLNEAGLTDLCIRGGGFCCKNAEAHADVVTANGALWTACLAQMLIPRSIVLWHQFYDHHLWSRNNTTVVLASVRS